LACSRLACRARSSRGDVFQFFFYFFAFSFSHSPFPIVVSRGILSLASLGIFPEDLPSQPGYKVPCWRIGAGCNRCGYLLTEPFLSPNYLADPVIVMNDVIADIQVFFRRDGNGMLHMGGIWGDEILTCLNTSFSVITSTLLSIKPKATAFWHLIKLILCLFTTEKFVDYNGLLNYLSFNISKTNAILSSLVKANMKVFSGLAFKSAISCEYHFDNQ